jgi:tetratricopeptide (TPR) repeat protein
MKTSNLSIIAIALLLVAFLMSCTATKKKESEELIRKGRLYTQFGKIDSALLFFNQAGKLDKSNYEPHFFKRNIYVGKGDFESALKESQKVLEKMPFDYPSYEHEWLHTGMLYDAYGDSAHAVQHYEKCIEISNAKLDTLTDSRDVGKYRTYRAFAYLLMGDSKGKKEMLSLSEEYPNQMKYAKFLDADKQEILQFYGYLPVNEVKE